MDSAERQKCFAEGRDVEPPRTADDEDALLILPSHTPPRLGFGAMSTSESGVGLDLCEAEQSALARKYVLKSELYVDEPWSHAGPRSVSPFSPCAASRMPHIFAAARLSRDSVLWDLGCGDGRVLHEAAARYGCRCVGVEIDAPCLDRCRARADAMGPDVASVCTWHLADMTAIPPGSLGADDALAPGVPSPSVLLIFITGHGLVALSPWLKREWLYAPTPFAVVTCVEALDACIDYELGVFGQGGESRVGGVSRPDARQVRRVRHPEGRRVGGVGGDATGTPRMRPERRRRPQTRRRQAGPRRRRFPRASRVGPAVSAGGPGHRLEPRRGHGRRDVSVRVGGDDVGRRRRRSRRGLVGGGGCVP